MTIQVAARAHGGNETSQKERLSVASEASGAAETSRNEKCVCKFFSGWPFISA